MFSLEAESVFFIATKQIVIVDAFNLKVNSPTTNEVTTILTRRGHPGNMIKCLETGEVFASQNRAANAMSLNPSEVSKVVRGLKDSAGGYHFENLGLVI